VTRPEDSPARAPATAPGARTAAIVLAAGGARRFGAAKQLALLGGRPLLQHAVDAVLAVPALEDVVVVLGARGDAVAAGVDLGRARSVRCEHWARGMAASLQAGVAALDPGVGVALILLGDQPLVTAPVIEKVLAAARGQGDAFVAVRAAYDGVPGHPVALGPDLLTLVPKLRGDAGARDLLAARDVPLVEAGGLGDGTDVDTPDDLEAIAP
jgi:CTP:molybdopterin cytidylyltransferase MocA